MKRTTTRVAAIVAVLCALSALLDGRPTVAQESAGLIAEAPTFRPVELPSSVRRAIERGTRTAEGVPGPKYWQQDVDYEIQVRLQPKDALLSGQESIRYRNNAPDTLSGLMIHLYQNLFSAGVERNRSVELTGGIQLHSVRAQGRALRELSTREIRRLVQRRERPVGYLIIGTQAQLFLPESLAPGDSAVLEFEWSYTVPGVDSFRQGHLDSEVFTIAQWYPQIAVYDDVNGFDTKPYLGAGEFYLEYGDFDVEITLPSGWLVTATGQLQNAGDVLTPEAQRRLDSAITADTVVAVVGTDDRRKGVATREGSDGQLTWHFRAERVRDFAFATSDRYVWDATGADVGDSRTRIDALYDPSIEHWRDAATYSRHIVEYFSRHITPYAYPHVSAAYGPVGGMEYPMLMFIGRSRPGRPLYSVLAHELSHQWFPMMVGSNEHAHAWMDEGFATYNSSLAGSLFFEGTEATQQDMGGYLRAVELEIEVPLMQHTDYVRSGYGRVIAAYSKPAILFHTLRHVLGEEVFHSACARYARAWRFKHPTPWDLFAILETEAGRDLDWFWQPWFFETATLDQGIETVQVVDGETRVTVVNVEEAVLPVHLEVEMADGSIHTLRWPVDVWAGTRRVTRSIEQSGRVVSVRLDPDEWFPDIDRSNNVWEADASTP